MPANELHIYKEDKLVDCIINPDLLDIPSPDTYYHLRDDPGPELYVTKISRYPGKIKGNVIIKCDTVPVVVPH